MAHNGTARAIDWLDVATYDDPWETYAWLRANAPVYRDEVNDLWDFLCVEAVLKERMR